MPLPMTTTSAVGGRSVVVRWPSSFLDGSRCQYECVLRGVGSSAWPSCNDDAVIASVHLRFVMCCGGGRVVHQEYRVARGHE